MQKFTYISLVEPLQPGEIQFECHWIQEAKGNILGYVEPFFYQILSNKFIFCFWMFVAVLLSHHLTQLEK